jgi:hypothetical protein
MKAQIICAIYVYAVNISVADNGYFIYLVSHCQASAIGGRPVKTDVAFFF